MKRIINTENYRRLNNYIKEILVKIQQKGEGFLPYPFLTVSYGQHYSGSIFGWDNHHMAMRIAYEGHPEYFKSQIDNMLLHQTENGYIPNVVNVKSGPVSSTPPWHAQPFLMQGMLMYLEYSNDLEWSKANFPKLKKYLAYWESSHAAPFGLFRWGASWMSGFDNDISTSIFQPDTIIPPDINAWLCLEYLAAEKIALRLNMTADAARFSSSYETLKTNINSVLWNEEASSYSSFNLLNGKFQFSFSDPYLKGGIGQYSFQSCSNLIPLYARLASQEQAASMIKKYVISPKHFWSRFGIRSLSRSSEYYNNAIWGNPPRFIDPGRLTNSNWQGPVWIPLNYFMFHALLFYGFRKEAEILCSRTANTLLNSMDKIGSFAENYNGENGMPLYCKNFASWNLLADVMPYEAENEKWLMNTIFQP